VDVFEAFYTDLFIWVAVRFWVFAIVFILAFVGADIIFAEGLFFGTIIWAEALDADSLFFFAVWRAISATVLVFGAKGAFLVYAIRLRKELAVFIGLALDFCFFLRV
jgi:hypothetical protein